MDIYDSDKSSLGIYYFEHFSALYDCHGNLHSGTSFKFEVKRGFINLESRPLQILAMQDLFPDPLELVPENSKSSLLSNSSCSSSRIPTGI